MRPGTGGEKLLSLITLQIDFIKAMAANLAPAWRVWVGTLLAVNLVAPLFPITTSSSTSVNPLAGRRKRNPSVGTIWFFLRLKSNGSNSNLAPDAFSFLP